MSRESEKIFDGITGVGEDLIEAAQEPVKKRRVWLKWGAAAAAVALIVGAAVLAHQSAAPSIVPTPPVEQNTQQVTQQTPPIEITVPADQQIYAQFLAAKAEYPVMVKITDDEEAWSRERWERREHHEQNKTEPGELDDFLTAALPHLLGGADGENRVCSPLNVYMALAMAAEISDGESRAQLLHLLDADSIETLEDRAGKLWDANYRDDGVAVSILASSLWMRGDTPYLKGAVQTLRDVYRASSFRGDMSDPKYTEAMREWLDEQTGGQLHDTVKNVTLDPETMLELVTTVYFRAKWLEQFDAANTSPETFHAPDGDTACDFLHNDLANFWAYCGENFTAVQQPFEDAGNMWFLLPDEGVTPESLLAAPEALAFLCSCSTEQAKWYYGKLVLPKFDVASEMELSDTLKALGITDVFDAGRADFSPLFENANNVVLSNVQHAARVMMDEEGVTATAFTDMGWGAGGPELEMDFTLDRPFLFVITGADDLPLFVGIVNHP